MPETNW